ncbi:Crp/Fnr family transcriptional regulator [Lentzea flaviverrucosa]|uniref:cAMP-binding domain of CRP or a regulatory subunit of cAMP-dependent protein kinases n=1 Tax=Lentzea flaviverrucosa TaxID=200379 RepID=A0A1H9XUN3_9PSEU|nr:Crp/Fnr family transcriptional regulator [Lentzea flaviverrucosa]RDI19205.1 CRP-like cAMP-binding protein [Lentzea flaviverrucosa]SES49403.1 cAMP-binding domain of CRP or a regulatory subunit of cAMP-dependent protein kinases [Lentzea flaviverrucosa]
MGIDQSFWEMLDDTDQKALLAAATRVSFEPAVVICHQGDRTRNVLVVAHGRVRVSRFSLSGEETVLAVRGPGEIIGEVAAVDGRGRSATLTAVDAVDGILIPALALKRLCEERPRLTWAVLRVVVARQRAGGDQQDFRTGPSLHRVGSVLLDLANRDASDMIATVPLSQRELAGIAGISRETLVRALKTLREAGIIATRRTRIEILREDELRSVCGI